MVRTAAKRGARALPRGALYPTGKTGLEKGILAVPGRSGEPSSLISRFKKSPQHWRLNKICLCRPWEALNSLWSMKGHSRCVCFPRSLWNGVEAGLEEKGWLRPARRLASHPVSLSLIQFST